MNSKKVDPNFVQEWIKANPDIYKELKEKYPETADEDFVSLEIAVASTDAENENKSADNELSAIKSTEIIRTFENPTYLKHLSIIDSKTIGKKLNLDEQNLHDILYKIMSDVHFEFQIYRTTKTFLFEQLGWITDHRSYKEYHQKLYDLFESLRINGREYNIFKRYTGVDKIDWEKISFISGFISEHSMKSDNIDNDIVEFSIGTKLRILLNNPKAFGRLSIDINITFKTPQAKKLYEYTIAECGLRYNELIKNGKLLIQIVGIKDKIHPLLEITNEKLTNKKLTILMEKTLMEINENPLSKVYVRALKMNEKTGKKKHVEPITKGLKKIIGYEYLIVEKSAVTEPSLFLANPEELDEIDNNEPDESTKKAIETLGTIYPQKNIVMNIIKIIEMKYPEYDLNAYISECIKYTKKSNTTNFQAYLRKTIEQDYPNYTQITKTLAESQKSTENKKSKITAREYKDLVDGYIQRNWDALSTQEKQTYKENAEAKIKESQNQGYITYISVEDYAQSLYVDYLEEADPEYKQILSKKPYR